ncbi:Hypothetical predicted protein, partial [Marmota monax]
MARTCSQELIMPAKPSADIPVELQLNTSWAYEDRPQSVTLMLRASPSTVSKIKPNQ